MAVAMGGSAQLLVDEFNMHQFARSFQVDPNIDMHDTSVLGTTSRSKTTGLRHATASGEFFYDDTADSGSYDVLKARYGSATPSIVTFAPQGFAVGSRTLQLYTHELGFNPRQVVDDLIRMNLSLEAAEDAVDFGVSLHAFGAETGTGNGTAVDNAASSANGGVAHLHVSAIAGAAPSVVIKVQHSTDNVTFGDLAGATFTAATAATKQRLEVAAGVTVNRYLRGVTTFGGTTTSITFQLSFARR